MNEVFISYAEPDAAWAERLASGLEHHGVPVFLDRCRLRPGDVIVHELESGIRNAGSGLQLFSRYTSDASWALEQYAALLQAAIERGLRLIPVLIDGTDLPPLAAGRVFFDARGLDESAFEGKVADLARVIRGERPGPRDAIAEEVIATVRRTDAARSAPPASMLGPAAFVLCYAAADAEYAERLERRLSAAGLPVWSIRDLTWGDDHVWMIRRQLRYAVGVIVLMSPAAEESIDLTREILESQRHGRGLFPILLAGDRHYLLASTSHFDARDGGLPGDDQLSHLRRLLDAHRSGRTADDADRAPRRPGATSELVRVEWMETGPPRAPTSGSRRDRPGTTAMTIDALPALLEDQELEHADVLSTNLLLDAAGRLEDGWLRRADGDRLPSDLLAALDRAWVRASEGAYGLSTQRRLATAAHGRHADFLRMSQRFGWRDHADETIPRYRCFFHRADGPGFFPTLRNPQSERHLDWYDQWAETVLAVHVKLTEIAEGGRSWLL